MYCTIDVGKNCYGENPYKLNKVRMRMINDLVPIIVDVKDKPNGIKIFPIADLHAGSPQFMKKEWEDFVARVKSDEDAYIIIAGDMMNNAIRNSIGCGVYGETMMPSEQKRWLAEQLMPLKDKILCGCNGNHEVRSRETDTDPLYDVFVILGIEERYRENTCFLILRFADKNGKIQNHATYTFCVTHGSGNAMYVGSSGNKAERMGMAIDNLDCLIYGHTHKPLTFPVGKLKIDLHNKKVESQQFTVVCATSWLGLGGYAMRAMYAPTAFKQNEIWLEDSRVKKLRVLQ